MVHRLGIKQNLYLQKQTNQELNLNLNNTQRIQQTTFLQFKNILKNQQNIQNTQTLLKKSKFLYLLIIYKLNIYRFRFEHYQQGAITIPFTWADSFNTQKSVAVPSIQYEKACIWYNLAILYYTEGLSLQESNDSDKRKQAIAKYRQGAWAITQTRNLALNIIPEVRQIHSDLTEENLDILYHLMIANSYVCLFQNLLPQEIKLGSNILAQIAQEASNNFTIGLSKVNECLKQGSSGINQEHLTQTKNSLYFSSVYYMIEASNKMIVYHNSELEDNLKGNHMGLALGYIKKVDNVLKQVLGNQAAMKSLNEQQKQALIALKNQNDQKYNEYNNRNQQIYKEQVSEGVSIEEVSDNLLIKAVEPKEFGVQLTVNEDDFCQFMNDEMNKLINEIKQFAF
ncbi:hypothetical protein IMG5_083280 [Ichthyophthirius multifiliis]|uniref:BRO1 domain-containing protein n=1 Tax=Ichthyophthirius multifiliis TaxID=5932 RepID=G0QQR9_ICHMU|nr:hypothetical protein IMG5_083280 [Ichthyophthirius multifiliis]EGR32440.1 hypothetical protein IMG5_083280 [Ichthyophthirius multifiliis]|eukprot:XP_004036426.1 hypothetical protein IMG5_083280 [Ichthyophthirius multifiliis]